MTNIARSGKPVDMEKVISQLLKSDSDPAQNKEIADLIAVLKKYRCPHSLVREYLKMLRELHDNGHPTACKWAHELACVADLPVRAVGWLFSPPKNLPQKRNYRQIRKQSLRYTLVYYQVCEILEEKRATSITEACKLLASELRKKDKNPTSGENLSGSGVEKAYYKHLKSILKLVPEGFSPRTWLTEREATWGD